MTTTASNQPTQIVRNTGRIAAARFALASHQWAKGKIIEEDETAVIDLLADLRHYCDAHAICFDDIDGIACGHYLIERPAGDDPNGGD